MIPFSKAKLRMVALVSLTHLYSCQYNRYVNYVDTNLSLKTDLFIIQIDSKFEKQLGHSSRKFEALHSTVVLRVYESKYNFSIYIY